MSARSGRGRTSVASRALVALLLAGLSGCGADGAAAPSLHGPAAVPLDRPDTIGTDLQFRFDPGDVVETFGSASGSFLVHFARDGRHAVPGVDADASGVPDFVEEVAAVYDEVLLHYRDDLGFRTPRSDEGAQDNGGDGRFDVYLVDFDGVGDGAFRVDGCGPESPDTCVGFMTQENDYRGYGYPSTLRANRILGSHELFHAVQAAYDANQGSVMAEGTAVWATESFDPSLRDFEGFIDGYLQNCERPLDAPLPGPVDPFSYGSALFFQFLEERYGQGTIHALWERVGNGANGEEDPVWFEQLEPLLATPARTTFADAFVDFATWNLFTATAADPQRAYAAGAGYPAVQMKDVSAPYSLKLRAFYASSQYYRAQPDGRAAMTAALAAPADAPDQTDGLAVLVAAQRGATYGDVLRLDDVTAGAQTVDTSGADRLVVVVVNGAQQGDSRKPTLCIGTPEEVAACRSAVVGGGGSGGAGGGEGGGAGEGGAAEPRPGAPATDDGGCGCRIVPPSGGARGYALGLALSALLRRRRRARPRVSAAAQAASRPPR
jgi:hypothetical protein